MPDQQNPPSGEKLNPEFVSLERRFGVQDAKGSHAQEEQEPVQENAREKTRAQNDTVYTQILSQVQSQSHQHDDDTITQDASALHQIADRESQISHLMDLAMTKGVAHAVKVAQRVEDYYVLDQLHDRMRAEEFYQALIAKGFIEQ
ncbi:MAG: hypothetical protein WC819_03200 [Parcubacteria group bacterium]|jgi:hypothetical protein